MKYSYTALSMENQKLTGVLDAGSLEAAQDELHKMGLSIISISEISEDQFLALKQKEVSEKIAKGIQTFEFEALDPNKKQLNGTIDANDPYAAYKRLTVEYKFSVSAVYPAGATDDAKAKARKETGKFAGQMEEEGISVKPRRNEQDESEKISAEAVKEIDKIITGTKKILEEHYGFYSMDCLREIENTLGQLERVRTSSNLKHISALCNRLYDIISNPDKAPAEDYDVMSQAYTRIITDLKNTSFVGKEFNISKQSAALKNIKNILRKLTGIFAGKKIKLTGVAGSSGADSQKPAQKMSGEEKSDEARAANPRAIDVISKFLSFAFASNIVFRSSRKQEFLRTLSAWRALRREKAKAAPKTKTAQKTMQAEEKRPGKDFSYFFTEADSFIAWLLFFYIIYFFLADFSLEKGFGIPRNLVITTLKTPILLNITIFLLFAHFFLRVKTLYFRRNFLGSLFLLSSGLCLYFILIVNF
jgi:hypothetical protein